MNGAGPTIWYGAMGGEQSGCWIWVTGNTYGAKDALKAAGFKWCNNKKAWSWHAGERYYKKSKRKLSMEELRNLYGSEEVKTNGANNRIA